MNFKWCCVGFIAILLLTICTEYSAGQINANEQSLNVVPRTNFECGKRAAGYYADIETGCQVYHMCDELGRQFSYACPNTTLFQQRMLICDHWYMVNCSDSESNYDANLLIGQRDKPFVRDDEHELRTPRPDLLDRPYAPDYTGESFRKQYKTLPALQNSLSNPNAKSDISQKRARAPIEQLRPFTVPPVWNHLQQQQQQQKQQQKQQPHRAADTPKFAALRRKDEEGNNDLKVASSQDSRRSENEDHTETGKANIQPPSREYTPPFLFPRYNENFTAEVASIATTTTTTTPAPTSSRIIINVPDIPKATQLNEVDFPNHQPENRLPKDTIASNLIQGRILSHIGGSPNAVLDDRHRPSVRIPDNTPTPIETNELLPVVPSNGVPEPATGLLPPYDTFTSYDDATQGPPIYYEWKIPASGLEPPKQEVSGKPATIEENQIPVLPPKETKKPTINIPILEKDLVPPIYDTHRLTLTKIRIPAFDLEPPKLVPPIVANDTVADGNHTFPSLAPLHGAIHNSTSDKSQTPRSVGTGSQTASSNIISTTSSSARATTKENNYLDLQKEFLIPSYTFPLETVDERPSYESNNVFNSFQVKLPDGSDSNNASSGNQWYGENAECPECHPSFLKPGTCEPCVKFR